MGADGFGVRHPRAKGRRVDAFSTTESNSINQSINQSINHNHSLPAKTSGFKIPTKGKSLYLPL
jgi:hypothetical protein